MYVQHIFVYCHYVDYSGGHTVNCKRKHCIALCGELDFEEANGHVLRETAD